MPITAQHSAWHRRLKYPWHLLNTSLRRGWRPDARDFRVFLPNGQILSTGKKWPGRPVAWRLFFQKSCFRKMPDEVIVSLRTSHRAGAWGLVFLQQMYLGSHIKGSSYLQSGALGGAGLAAVTLERFLLSRPQSRLQIAPEPPLAAHVCSVGGLHLFGSRFKTNS